LARGRHPAAAEDLDQLGRRAQGRNQPLRQLRMIKAERRNLERFEWVRLPLPDHHYDCVPTAGRSLWCWRTEPVARAMAGLSPLRGRRWNARPGGVPGGCTAAAWAGRRALEVCSANPSRHGALCTSRLGGAVAEGCPLLHGPCDSSKPAV